jgi:hypothetical protein
MKGGATECQRQGARRSTSRQLSRLCGRPQSQSSSSTARSGGTGRNRIHPAVDHDVQYRVARSATPRTRSVGSAAYGRRAGGSPGRLSRRPGEPESKAAGRQSRVSGARAPTRSPMLGDTPRIRGEVSHLLRRASTQKKGAHRRRHLTPVSPRFRWGVDGGQLR